MQNEDEREGISVFIQEKKGKNKEKFFQPFILFLGLQKFYSDSF